MCSLRDMDEGRAVEVEEELKAARLLKTRFADLPSLLKLPSNRLDLVVDRSRRMF
jgi:hypothetical protein